MSALSRGRLHDDQGHSRGCLLEQLHPEYARQPRVAARFVALSQRLQRDLVPGARPVLTQHHHVAPPGLPEAWQALDHPEATPLPQLIEHMGGQVEPGMALLLADMVAEALSWLHAAGCFHGELTMDQVSVGSQGQIWLDGLVVATCGRELLADSQARAHWHKAQQGWLAPEVLRQVAVAASDLYFVGALFYRLLTGQPHPQEWEPRWSMLMATLPQAGVQGRELTPTLHLLHRTLAERPEQRFATLAQLREHLDSQGLTELRPKRKVELLQQLQSLREAQQRAAQAETLASEETHPRRDPGEQTRLLPQHVPVLPQALRDKIGPHPLEILARSRYTILQELGVGGMGTVYEALDRELDQVLALKVLHRDMLTRPGTLERFRRELRLTRQLNHPHIVPAYHLEAFEGLYLYSMKYVRGPTLRHLIRHQGALPVEQVVWIMCRVADALERTHSVGVVHRDIKSANIMLERSPDQPPHPYLMDFGIAADRSLPAITRTGQQLGTPQYMAPEQAMGQPVSSAADIYSFAVVCYEALTGQIPFSAETAVAVYAAQVKEDYRPPRELVPDIPDALEELLTRCLRPEPEQRPASMTEILEVLDTLDAQPPPKPGEKP